MVGVAHDPVFTTEQTRDALVEIVEADVEVVRIASSRLEAEASRSERSPGHQGQCLESDER